jgi:Ca2+-binding EF-hand superfamily protein
VGEKRNIVRANQLLRAALAEMIDELGDKLSPARAEALLDEFEHDISGAFLLQDVSAVTAHCEAYARRFRALGEEKD